MKREGPKRARKTAKLRSLSRESALVARALCPTTFLLSNRENPLIDQSGGLPTFSENSGKMILAHQRRHGIAENKPGSSS